MIKLSCAPHFCPFFLTSLLQIFSSGTLKTWEGRKINGNGSQEPRSYVKHKQSLPQSYLTTIL